MASSGSFNTSGYDGRYLNFSWQTTNKDVANNRTTIKWTLKGAGGSSYSWYMSGNFKVKINGNQVYYSSTRIKLYNGTTVATGTYTINHNADGTAKFSASAEAGIYTVAVNCSGSKSWTLDTIPRASQPSINSYPNNSPNFNIGDKIVIHMNRASTVFTHSVYIRIGSEDRLIASGVADNYTFDTSTIADELYALIPNANVYSNVVTVQTYNGSTLIGSKTCAYNAHVVNANPTFNNAYLDSNAATVAITGNNQKIVRNQSTLRVNVTDAVALKSATLASASVTVLGRTVSASISGSTATLNVGTLDTSQDVTASVTVTDSRGNSTTKELNISVLNWELPTAIITLQRHNNFYSDTDIKVDANYSSVDDKNTIDIKVRQRKEDETTWSGWTALQDNVTSVLTLDNDEAWIVQVVLTDKFGSTTYNLTLSRGMPIVYYDRKRSSTGFNMFPKYDKSVEIDGRLFVQNEDIISKFTGIGGIARLAPTDDWNTACETLSGIYMGSNMQNAPENSTNWFYVFHMAHNDLYQRQVAYDFFGIDMWTRRKDNGTWSEWYRVDLTTGTYTASEVKTGGTFIDGSPIYKKTIGPIDISTAADHSMAHNISNLDKFVKVEGIAISSAGAWPLPFVITNDLNQAENIRLNATSANVWVNTRVARSGCKAYVTVYYTKSS